MLSRFGRVAALVTGTILALACFPGAAVADDALTVIGGSNAGAFYEVLDHVAERAGFFKEQHLNVTKQYTASASICAQLVATGKGDVCSLSIEPIIQGYAKGLRLQFFFSRDPRYDYVLAVLDSSPIRTLADFKGKDIGEINAGSTSEISANDMLSGAGLKKGDYNFVPIGSESQALAGIVAGKVEAASFPTVALGSMAIAGNVKFRIFYDPLLNDIPNVGYAARPETIQNKADALKRYCRAVVEAALLARENPRVAARYFLEGAGINVTDATLENETRQISTMEGDLPAADPSNARIGYLPLRGIELYGKFFVADGLTAQLVPASAIVTNEFIEYANDFDKRAFIARVKQLR
jgi:NitT/TauT family transport system substrate-binding protein